MAELPGQGPPGPRRPVLMVVYRSSPPPATMTAALMRRGHSVLERQVVGGQGLEGPYEVSVVVAVADAREHKDRAMLESITVARPRALLLVIAPSGSDLDHMAALECGAHCCLGPEVGPDAVAAHVDALTRLSTALAETETHSNELGIGDIAIDFARRQVRVAGRLVDLTRSEFDIFAVLATSAGRVLSPHDILSMTGQPAVSGHQARDIVKAHVCRLRQKLGIPPGELALLQTVRGVGYVLERRNVLRNSGSGGTQGTSTTPELVLA